MIHVILMEWLSANASRLLSTLPIYPPFLCDLVKNGYLTFETLTNMAHGRKGFYKEEEIASYILCTGIQYCCQNELSKFLGLFRVIYPEKASWGKLKGEFYDFYNACNSSDEQPCDNSTPDENSIPELTNQQKATLQEWRVFRNFKDLRDLLANPEDRRDKLIKELRLSSDRNFSHIVELQLKVSDLEMQLKMLSQRTTTGTCIWAVDKMADRMTTTTCFYSPPFYTHYGGYKLGIRFYPNGDGSGEGTHASIFLFLMPGEYDDILTWPFKGVKFSIEILTQQAGMMNIRHTMITNHSTSWEKPVYDMNNRASGIPKFCTYEEMKNMIRHDKLVIKVKVVQSTLPPDLHGGF